MHIRTASNSRGKGRIIDVSEDVTAGSVTRVLHGVSSARISLLNQSRKYDGMFTPMDTITIRLRRIKTVLKFSGYLDAVPLWAAEQGSINLRASCSLKRLANFLWDPTSPAAMMLLNKDDPNRNLMNDGGMAQRAINVLTEVARWPKAQIHIARVPESWYDRVGAIADQLIAESESLQMMVSSGAGAWVGGENPLAAGQDSLPGIGKGTGNLPARSGRISHFGGPGGGAYGKMALTGEDGVHTRDDWYCAMRWPYTQPGAVQGAKEWWVNRRILVVNPKNNKAVVLRAADWGPHISTGRVIDVSPRALSLLGAATDDTVHISFAPENANLGPVTKADAGLGAILGPAGTFDSAPTTSSATSWGQPGDKRNIVQARAAGITFYVHRLAKANFEGFVNDLVSELGYHPRSIGGYKDRDIEGTNTKSNHAWGLAIDIDPNINPRYGSGAGGRYALPKRGLVPLARKWGLGWGGEWNNSKDYMHFEVIGAPASDTYDGVSGSGTGSVVVAKWRPPIHGKYTLTARFGEGGSHWSNGHSGTDFAVSSGTNIYPVGPGTVHDKGFDADAYGNWVSIDHGNKVYTFYAHMNAPSTVAVGEPVTTNTVIGHVGSTGNVTGPHVHVELRKGADTYQAALASGGIDKYVLGGANRSDPPAGTQAVEADASTQGIMAPDLTPEQISRGLFNVWQFNAAQASQGGILLGGYRAVMNDDPVLNTVGGFMSATLRDWCSAPNGDFIGWFPDYFGHYGQAGKMVLSPLEIDLRDGPPTIGWSDENLKTHQFVSGATSYLSGDASSIFHQATTAGIASVEFPELMTALLGITRKEAEQMRDDYLSRYGARPEYEAMNNISGARQEFFFACHKFMQNWSAQYQTQVALTFVPELYPGMLMCLPMYGVQGYIRETTDSWDMQSGFRTHVSCAPWSTIGDSSKVPAYLPKGAPL